MASLALSNSLKELPKCWLKAEKSLIVAALSKTSGIMPVIYREDDTKYRKV
jgi:hypothetical protein